MAGSRFKRRSAKTAIGDSALAVVDTLDYSQGFDTFTANDAIQPGVLRFSQDARISTLGRMITRLGADFYSDALGDATIASITSTTGSADQAVTSTTWYAEKFTGTATRLTNIQLSLKTNTATAPLRVDLYSDVSSAPGVKLASSSIANSDITGSYTNIKARFIEAPLLSATTFWIVVHVQEEDSNSYYWQSNTATTTALKSTDSGSNWSSTTFSMLYITTTATDSAVIGLTRAYKSSGTKETLMASGTTLSKVNDSTGVLTTVKSGLSSASVYRFANINDEVFYVNGVDAPRKYNFTTDAAMGGTPATASLVIAHQDLIWLNDISDPTKITFSDEDSYETSASTNFIYVPSPKSPSPIVGWVSMNGVLHIYTTTGKYMIYGVDKATFELVESPVKKGSFSQETITRTRNHIYFLSDDGVYADNGSEVTLISHKITDIIEGIVDKSSAVLAVNKNRLFIYYKASGSGNNNKCLVYNLDYQSWESQDTNQIVSHAVTFDGGDDNFEYITGSALVGQASEQYQASNNYSDMGAPLSLELRTAYLHAGEPNAKKRFKRWYPRFKKQTRVYNATVGYDSEFANKPTTSSVAQGATGTIWGGGKNWGSGEIWGSSQFDNDRVHVPGHHHYLQLRVSKTGVDTPVEFLGHALHYKKKRVR